MHTIIDNLFYLVPVILLTMVSLAGIHRLTSRDGKDDPNMLDHQR